MSQLLDWAESAGLENLKFRLQNSETLAKDASTTLTMLIAGIGGTLAYVVKGLEAPQITAITYGLAALSLWLMIVATLLIVKCILTTSLETPTNEPKNLYQKDYDIELLRVVELDNIQLRIDRTTIRNAKVANWLDNCRIALVLSPVVFVVVTIVAWAR